MTITASLSKKQRPALQRAFSCRLRATQAALFQVQLQISEPKPGLFSAAYTAEHQRETAERTSRAVFQDRVCSAAPLLPKTRRAAPATPADFSPSAPSQ